jgi:hypothetical protein
LPGQQNHPGRCVAHDPMAGREIQTRSCACRHPACERHGCHLPLTVSPWTWPGERGDAFNAGNKPGLPLFPVRSLHPLMTCKKRAGVGKPGQQRVRAGGPALPTPQQGISLRETRQPQDLAPGQRAEPLGQGRSQKRYISGQERGS